MSSHPHIKKFSGKDEAVSFWQKELEKTEDKDLFKDEVRIWGHQYLKKNSYYYFVAHINDVKHLLTTTKPDQIMIYEYTHLESKPVFDLEYCIDENKNEDHRQKMLDCIDYIVEQFAIFYKIKGQLNYTISTSFGTAFIYDKQGNKSGEYRKASMHVVIYDVVLEDIELLKDFTTHLHAMIESLDYQSAVYQLTTCWKDGMRKIFNDTSIHGNKRIMRINWSTKRNENRPLLPLDEKGKEVVAFDEVLFDRGLVQASRKTIKKAKEDGRYITDDNIGNHTNKKYKTSSKIVLSIKETKISDSHSWCEYGISEELKNFILEEMKTKSPHAQFDDIKVSDDKKKVRIHFANTTYCYRRGNSHQSNRTFFDYKLGGVSFTASCYDKECKKEPVEIMIPKSILRNNYKKPVHRYPNMICVNKKFLDDSIQLDSRWKTLRIVSPMYTAKTATIQKVIREMIDDFKVQSQENPQAMFPRIYFITENRSLANQHYDQCTELMKGLMPLRPGIVTHYEDVIKKGGTFKDKVFIIIQLESIHRLNDCAAPKLLVLDECSSLISHFSSDTMKYYKNKIWVQMEGLLTLSDKVIAADADYNDLCEDVLKEYRSEEFFTGISNLYIKDKVHTGEGYRLSERICVIVKNEADILDRLVERLLLGQKCAIVGNIAVEKFKSFVEMASDRVNKQRLSLQQEPLKILIHSSQDTHNSDKLKNTSLHWINYDIVGFTPTVTVGVNFDVLHFDAIFALATNTTNTVTSFIQQLGRIRLIKQENFYLYFKKTKLDQHDLLPITFDDVVKDINANISAHSNDPSLRFQIVNNQLDADGNPIVKTELFIDMYTKVHIANTIETNISTRFFLPEFISKMLALGVNIQRLKSQNSKDEINVVRSEMNQLIHENRSDMAQQVINSRDISDIEATMLMRNPCSNQTQKAQLQKYQIISKHGEKALTENFIISMKKMEDASQHLIELMEPINDTYNITKFKDYLSKSSINSALIIAHDNDMMIKPSYLHLTRVDAINDIKYTQRFCIEHLLDLIGIKIVTLSTLSSVVIKSDDITVRIACVPVEYWTILDSYFIAGFKRKLLDSNSQPCCRKIISLINSCICRPLSVDLKSSKHKRKIADKDTGSSLHYYTWCFDQNQLSNLFAFAKNHYNYNQNIVYLLNK